MNSNSKALIIFDIDGTLIDARKSWMNSANKICKEAGLAKKYTYKSVQSMVSLGTQPLIDDLNILLGQDCLNVFWEIVFNDFKLDIQGHFSEAFFEKLREKFEVAAFTNKSHAKLSNLIQALGHSWGFNRILCGDEVPRKPSPYGLELLCREFGVSRKETLFFGDNRYDHDAAMEASIDYVHCKYGYDIEFKTELALIELDSPSSVEKFLETKIGYL